MKTFRIIFVAILMLMCKHEMPVQPNGASVEPQWAMYGGNVRHTGNVNTPAYDGIVGPTDSNTVQTKWAIVTNDFVGTHGGGVEAPLVADANGTIYATTSLGLIALNSDGSLKWVFDEGGKSSVATGDNGTVFYHGRTGYLYALANDGSVLWKTLTVSVPDAHPLNQTSLMNIILINDNTVVLSSRDSVSFSIIAIDSRDGSVLWQQFEVSGAINGAANDGTIYLSEPNHFIALNASGSLKWTVPTEYAIGGNFHVAVDGAGNIYKWPEKIAQDGRIVSQGLLGSNIALWFDRYYTTTGLKDTLFCVSISDNQILWRVRHDVAFLSYPTVDHLGNVYVASSGFQAPQHLPGFLRVYDKEGKLVNRYIFELPDNFILTEPFAPVLLPDGSAVLAGYEDVAIVCVR